MRSLVQRYLSVALVLSLLAAGAASAQTIAPSGGGMPSGPAGGTLSGTYPNPTFGISSNPIATTASPASAWNFDGSGSSITVPANGNAAIAVGAGLIIMTDTTASGVTCMFILGSTAAVLVSQSLSTFCVASTTTPGAGKYSIAYDGTANYRIYNGNASSVTFTVVALRSRNLN